MINLISAHVMLTTDLELLQRMQRGDAEAFKVLYQRYHQRVFRFALMDSGGDVVAADVTQEVFMQLIDNVSFDPERGDLGAYLLGMARNLVRRHRRENQRYETLVGDEEGSLYDALIEHREPSQIVSGAQQQRDLRASIIALPAHFREVVLLCELEELDYAAAARILDIPIGTVRSRLNRARKALAAAMTAGAAARSTNSGESYELRAV